MLKAFVTDVSPILAEARGRGGGAIDPIGVYRAPNTARPRRRSVLRSPAHPPEPAGVSLARAKGREPIARAQFFRSRQHRRPGTSGVVLTIIFATDRRALQKWR
jgi:hypothetical protein